MLLQLAVAVTRDVVAVIVLVYAQGGLALSPKAGLHLARVVDGNVKVLFLLEVEVGGNGNAALALADRIGNGRGVQLGEVGLQRREHGGFAFGFVHAGVSLAVDVAIAGALAVGVAIALGRVRRVGVAWRRRCHGPLLPGRRWACGGATSYPCGTRPGR